MSATDELRRMLDERGVWWHGDIATYWRYADAVESLFADNALDVSLYAVSPEQAIEATLGRGTCEMEYVSDFMSWHCKACGQMDMAPRNPKPRYCKWCGRKVVSE